MARCSISTSYTVTLSIPVLRNERNQSIYSPHGAHSRGSLRVFMRNRFDQLAKQLGQAALGSSGITVVNDPINPETQYADLRHEPDPARQAARDQLGLLGRMAGGLCLLEVYSQAPSAEEFRACLAKHLALWQQRARKARAVSKGHTARALAASAEDAPSLTP